MKLPQRHKEELLKEKEKIQNSVMTTFKGGYNWINPEYKDVTRDGNSLNLISVTNTSESSYKLSMTEINLGQSQTVNIAVREPSVTQNGIPVSIARFYKAS